jgi:hypothetical protein
MGVFRIHAKKLRAGERVEGAEHEEERPERRKLRRAILTALRKHAEKR